MAPPPSTVVSLVVTLMLRVLTFIFLLISLITSPPTTPSYLPISPRSRSDLVIFMLTMYMLFTILIGLAYTSLQTLFTIYQMSTGNHLGVTGAAAGFGATIDLKSVLEGNGSGLDPFFNKGNAAASLLLLCFLCTAVLSILSSLALPKRGY
ncbi:unnamed protein product [Camellia sinensis]